MVDIVIVGGGVIGSSTAYHLAEAGRAGEVVVIEPDPTYEWAATPRSSGGVRQLYSVEENILMGQYGLEVYSQFAERMAVGGEPAHIDFRRQGYLFMASGAEEVDILHADWGTQTSLGARVDFLDGAGVKRRFPSIRADDVDAAAHSADDGWIDPYSALMGYRRKAQSLGIRYLRDRVVEIEADLKQVRRVVLESGEQLKADILVNAAGAWAPEVCAMVGMQVPIEAMKRMTFYFEVREELEPMPLTKDFTGLSFRPEGSGYISGLTNYAQPAGFDFEVDHAWFDDIVWPGLARRVQAFEALKAGRSWAGHYAQNRLDGNVIIGPWTGGLENFYVAIGFSGHGLQQAPAIGRAMKELLLDGGYKTLDLSRLSYQRVLDNAPLAERGPVS